MSKSPPAVAIAAAAAALLVVPGLAQSRDATEPLRAEASAKATITMSGSTSVYPLAVKLGKLYVKKFSGRATFKILQGGTDIGINDVARGRVSIGNASRDPISGSDPGGLNFSKIARDGVCVITNKKNPIGQLSQAQVQQIFSGRTRSWKDVSGAKVSGAIDIVTRTASSGTADAFQNIFLGPNVRIAGNAPAKQSNGLVRQTVASDPNAIGFVSLDFINGVHTIGYKGVGCTLRNAISGQYAGVRNFWMVTKGAPKGPVAAFIKWVKTSGDARSAIASNWLPLS